MKRLPPVALAFALLVSLATPGAQEREDRTLLSWDQVRAIVNEASGERAMHHVLELVPYPRVRARAEYEGRFRETEVVERFAKEYGFSNVEVESMPSPQPLWQPSRGELWMTAPERQKLCDIYDVAVSLGANSAPGSVTAALVDVGEGSRADDYTGKDVAGKIVLGSASMGALQRRAVFEHGAAGVVSYSSIRVEGFPDQVASQGLSATPPEGKAVGFGWSVSPRMGRALSERLGRGEAITLQSIVEAETFPGELEMVHATIPGDGSTDQAVMISAHLYEGYIKQGANDDNSGCALTLEMGRAYLRLVGEGKLPKPKRTIHFLWVPEISGSMAWLEKHADVKRALIADLNFDMEGIGLARSGSAWVLHRTPDTMPSFLNDVAQSVLEFYSELNRERIRFRTGGYGFSLPVVSPNGSLDPFYIKVDKYYGASDHVVFLGQGIPGVMFITWPDMWYHSSQDTPDKLDPTQFKRAAVVGISTASVIASADAGMAVKVLAESLGRGTERMGANQRKGLGYLADARDGAALPDAYREATNAVRHQAGVEKGVLRSASVLFATPAAAEGAIAPLEALVDRRAAQLGGEVKGYYALAASQRQVAPVEPTATALDKEAARMVPERVPPPAGAEARGFASMFMRVPPEAAKLVPPHMSSEVTALLAQKKTVLEIRDFLSGEFEPVPLSDVVEYFRQLEKANLVKIVTVPESPARRAKP
jgi:hypothetical protein